MPCLPAPLTTKEALHHTQPEGLSINAWLILGNQRDAINSLTRRKASRMFSVLLA